MAREDWTYPPMQKALYSNIQRAVENLNKGRARPKYASPRDFIVAAVVDLLEKEGQLEVAA